jgi:hypothetical protein
MRSKNKRLALNCTLRYNLAITNNKGKKMKIYKIEGHEVREIESTDNSFLYYIESVGQPNRRKWICKVYCTEENKVIELSFVTIKEARESLKMFGYSYKKIA